MCIFILSAICLGGCRAHKPRLLPLGRLIYPPYRVCMCVYRRPALAYVCSQPCSLVATAADLYAVECDALRFFAMACMIRHDQAYATTPCGSAQQSIKAGVEVGLPSRIHCCLAWSDPNANAVFSHQGAIGRLVRSKRDYHRVQHCCATDCSKACVRLLL